MLQTNIMAIKSGDTKEPVFIEVDPASIEVLSNLKKVATFKIREILIEMNICFEYRGKLSPYPQYVGENENSHFFKETADKKFVSLTAQGLRFFFEQSNKLEYSINLH